MTTESDYFDTELFIEEIRNLPCLWDYTTAAYSNRIDKERGWEYLCSKFYDNFEEKEIKEKNDCAIKLQRKWRSLRDSYNRDFKKNNTPKSGFKGYKHRKYLYHDNLYFLKPIAERRAIESSTKISPKNEDPGHSNEDRQYNEDGQYNQENTVAKQKKSTKRKIPKTTGQENDLIKKLSNRFSDHTSGGVDYTDSDLHFLLSLYDRFKAIDNNLKTEAQIEILNVIKKFSYTHPQTYNYSFESHRDGRYDGYRPGTTSYEQRQNQMPSFRRHPSTQVDHSEPRDPIQTENSEFRRLGTPHEYIEFRTPKIELSPDAEPANSPDNESTSQDSILSDIFD